VRWHKLSFFSLLGNRIIQDALAEIRILDHVYTWLFCEFTGEPQWAFLSVDKETNSCRRVRPLLFKKLFFSNFSRLSDHTFTKTGNMSCRQIYDVTIKICLLGWKVNELNYIKNKSIRLYLCINTIFRKTKTNDTSQVNWLSLFIELCPWVSAT